MTRLSMPTLQQLAPLPTLKNIASPLIWSGNPQDDRELEDLALDLHRTTSPRTRTAYKQPTRRKHERLNPEDPETYKKLLPAIERVKETSSNWGEFFKGLGRVLDIIDIPRMAVNKAINLAIGAKASSPDKSIMGGERIYGADFMRHFGIDNRAMQMVGGFVWDLLTDPLSWVTGIGGIFKSAGKASVGGVTKTLTKNLAVQFHDDLARGTGTAIKNLARSGKLTLAGINKIDDVAKAAGLSDDMARLASRATRATKINDAHELLRIEKGIADLITKADKGGAARKAIGELFEEVVKRGGMERKGLRFTTDVIRNFPILKKVTKRLPSISSREILKPGALASVKFIPGEGVVRHAPRLAGAVQGALIGGATGNIVDAPIQGALVGAAGGAMLGPRIQEALAPIAKGFRKRFSHARRGAAAMEEQWSTATRVKRSRTMRKFGDMILEEDVAPFKNAVEQALGVPIELEKAKELLTAASELEAKSPENLVKIWTRILAEEVPEGAATISSKIMRGHGAKQALIPELLSGQATHVLVPDGNEWLVIKGAADDTGRLTFSREEIVKTLEDALEKVDTIGGEAVIGQLDDAGNVVSPRGLGGASEMTALLPKMLGKPPVADSWAWQAMDMGGDALSPEVSDAVRRMKQRSVQWLTEVADVGVPQVPLADEAVTYTHHYLEQQEKLWQSVSRWMGFKGGKKAAHQWNRLDKWRGKSIAEMNLALKAMDSPALMSTDPTVFQTARQLGQDKVLGQAGFLRELRDSLGTLITDGDIPDGLEIIRGVKSPQMRMLDGYAFTPDVVEFMQGIDKQWQRPSDWLHAFDRVMSQLKGIMLVAPAFHSRNLGSNIWLSASGDGFSLGGWSRGFRALRASRKDDAAGLSRVLENLQGVVGGKITYGQLIEACENRGMLGTGFAWTELAPSVHDALTQGAKASSIIKKMSPAAWSRYNRAIGGFIEDGSKLGHVITRLRAGDTVDQAIASAQRFMFDYGDLTAFERSTMRRVFPFYSWARHNFQLQTELLFQRPEFAAAMAKAKGNVEASLPEGETVPAALRPKYIREEAGIQVAGGVKPGYMNMATFFPLNELKMLDPSGLTDAALDALNPIPKMALEFTINRDLFWDKPIRSYPGQTDRFLGLDVPPEMRKMLSIIRPLSEINRVTRGIERGERVGSVAGRAFGMRVFEGNVPGAIAGYERKQAETRGYMRSKAKISLSRGDPGRAENIANLFDELGMAEDAVKIRIMIAEAARDFSTAQELSLQLAEMRRVRLGSGASSTQIRELTRSLRAQ